MTVQEALEAQRKLAEVAAEAKAEQEGVEVLKVVLTEFAKQVVYDRPSCKGCLECDDCDIRDEVPDIDLDGFYLD